MADKNLVVKKGIEVSETGSFGGNLSTLGNLTVSGTVSGVTKAMVGLSDVDNTTDANKPISTATQTALNTKVPKVTSTDNALVRFDGTTGDVQNSLVTVDDGGVLRIGQKTIFSKYFPFDQSGVSATYHELFRVAAWGASETSGRFTVAVQTGSDYLVSASYEWTSNFPGAVSLTQTSASNYWGVSFKIAADCDYLGSVIFSVNFPLVSYQTVVDVILSGESYIGGFTLSSLAPLDAPPIGYTRVIDGRAFLPGYSTVGNAGAFLDKLLVGKSIDDGINKLQVEGGLTVLGGLLGTVVGNSVMVSKIGASTINYVFNAKYVLRRRAGDVWYSAVFHDAIGVDNSYITPTVDTKCWWERDPYTETQAWGNGASTQLMLAGGNLGIGTGTTIPTEKLHVVGNVLATGYKTPNLDGVEQTGASGTFTSADNKTITVTNGLITLITQN